MKHYHSVHARVLFWCSALSATTALWLVVQFTPTLPGQQALDPQIALVEDLKVVKRVCVEQFEGGENATQLRAMLIDQLRRMGAFLITENPARADAFLRGFAEDLVYTEEHSRDENIGARNQNSIATGGYTRNRRAISGSASANESVRERSTSRRHEAALTVRIVNAEGDVLWSASAESKGGKFRSAAGDVSARIAADLEKTLNGSARISENGDSKASANSPASAHPAPN